MVQTESQSAETDTVVILVLSSSSVIFHADHVTACGNGEHLSPSFLVLLFDARGLIIILVAQTHFSNTVTTPVATGSLPSIISLPFPTS